jgi:hypothetical protein
MIEIVNQTKIKMDNLINITTKKILNIENEKKNLFENSEILMNSKLQIIELNKIIANYNNDNNNYKKKLSELQLKYNNIKIQLKSALQRQEELEKELTATATVTVTATATSSGSDANADANANADAAVVALTTALKNSNQRIEVLQEELVEATCNIDELILEVEGKCLCVYVCMCDV